MYVCVYIYGCKHIYLRWRGPSYHIEVHDPRLAITLAEYPSYPFVKWGSGEGQG